MSDVRRRTATRRAAALVALSVVLGALAARFHAFPGDRALAGALRDVGDPFAALATTANEWHGAGVGLVIVAAVIAAVRRRRIDVLAAIVIAGAGRLALNAGRALVDRPRPSGEEIVARVVAAGPSFPSGHVMTAMLACGLWFALAPALVPPAWVRPVRGAAVLGVTLTAFARVWAGVHWPSDALGAVVWMAAVLAVAVAMAPRAGEVGAAALRRARRSPSPDRGPSA